MITRLTVKQVTVGEFSCSVNWFAEPLVKAKKDNKYFERLVNDSYSFLKSGEWAYVFTQEQIRAIERKALINKADFTFTVSKREGVYVLKPIKKGEL